MNIAKIKSDTLTLDQVSYLYGSCVKVSSIGVICTHDSMINGESSLLIDNFVFITKEKNFFPFYVDIPVKIINKHIFHAILRMIYHIIAFE